MKIIQRVHHVRSGILTFGELRKPNYEKQSVTIPRFFPVPVLFSGTCTGTFFRYLYRYSFPWPIFSGTDTGTTQKYLYQIPGNFSVPAPNFSDTDTSNFFRYQIFPAPVPSKKEPGCHILLRRLRSICYSYKLPIPGMRWLKNVFYACNRWEVQRFRDMINGR